MNVFAILRTAAEFPDRIAATIAELFIVSISEFFSQCLCAILCDDGIVCKLVSENMLAVERLNLFENFCVEYVADA